VGGGRAAYAGAAGGGAGAGARRGGAAGQGRFGGAAGTDVALGGSLHNVVLHSHYCCIRITVVIALLLHLHYCCKHYCTALFTTNCLRSAPPVPALQREEQALEAHERTCGLHDLQVSEGPKVTKAAAHAHARAGAGAGAGAGGAADVTAAGPGGGGGGGGRSAVVSEAVASEAVAGWSFTCAVCMEVRPPPPWALSTTAALSHRRTLPPPPCACGSAWRCARPHSPHSRSHRTL
jgi:hypothetical protein